MGSKMGEPQMSQIIWENAGLTICVDHHDHHHPFKMAVFRGIRRGIHAEKKSSLQACWMSPDRYKIPVSEIRLVGSQVQE